MVRRLLLAACAALLALPAGAAAFRLPPHTKTTLANGLTVIVMPTRRLPLVDLRLVARAGAVNDPAGREGLAGLTAELLTQGAGTRDARQIAEGIAFVGGTLDASAATEQVVVTCEVLKKDLAAGLELFSDVIARPTFPEAEFKRKQSETLGAIAAQKDDPGTVANNELGPFLMGESPLAHPVIGYAKTVGALARDDVVAFHRRFLVPGRCILAVVGDVDAKAVLAALERAFADWRPSGEKPADSYAPLPRDGGRQVLIVSKPEVTQSQIRLACGGVPRNHPDYFAITVANTILGGGFTSRLMNEIRVNQGLTYGISSRWGMFRNAGTFTISTFTRNEKLRKAVDATLGAVKQLVDEGPTEQELAKARRYLTGQYPLGLQAPDALATQLATVEFYGLPSDYIETYTGRIEAVTMTDVKRVLKERFCTDDLKLLVVSNPRTAQESLAGLGPIQVKEME